jgi:hypothetical protein
MHTRSGFCNSSDKKVKNIVEIHIETYNWAINWSRFIPGLVWCFRVQGLDFMVHPLCIYSFQKEKYISSTIMYLCVSSIKTWRNNLILIKVSINYYHLIIILIFNLFIECIVASWTTSGNICQVCTLHL